MRTAEETIAIQAADSMSDYGRAVMAAQAEATEPTADERVKALGRQVSEAHAELDAATNAAHQGDAEAAGRVNLPALAARISDLRSQLETARGEAAQTEAERERREREELGKKFDFAVAQARVYRAEFKTAYRLAVIALGQFVECQECAVDSRNRLSIGMMVSDPWRDAELREITNRGELEVFDQLCAEGFDPRLGCDWNFEISPLAKKAGQ